MTPKHLLLIDIDGLRPDVFQAALENGRLPHIARLLGGPEMERGVQIPIVSSAPSITFCAQASLFTGAHPKAHGIPGNQFFDRFGSGGKGQARFYAFDVGDTLAVDDAVRVFSDGLAQKRLQAPLLYEGEWAQSAVVAGHMYAHSGSRWLKPSLVKMARFIKGRNLFGMKSAAYDRYLLDKLLHHIGRYGLDTVTTLYFMGIDQESHRRGPEDGQPPYLINHVDPMIGELWDAVLAHAGPQSVFVALFSDHGHIAVIPDDKHSLRIGFPFDREMGYLFDALGLDVHDYPGEDPNCDAVMALNGGLAYVYLHNQNGRWPDAPVFARDVLPVGRAFWDAHLTGNHAPELHGALAGVLLRNVERDGWYAGYQALTPDGEIVSLEKWFAQQPQALYVDATNRLQNMAGPFCGDLVLISNYAGGYYFGGENAGVHGGLHPDDSYATLVYGWPHASRQQWQAAHDAIVEAIEARCRQENQRVSSTADLPTGLQAIFPLDR